MRTAIVNGRLGIIAAQGRTPLTVGKVFVLFDDERGTDEPSAGWFPASVAMNHKV